MFKAYKYRIYPNISQIELIAKHIGCARWVYNYGLEKKIKAYTTEKKNLYRMSIQRDLPILKKQPQTEWLAEVNAQTLQASLEHLDKAFNAFFNKRSKFPKFKSKHDNKQSFKVLQRGKIDFTNSKLCIPKFTPIKIKIDRQFTGDIKYITISKTPTDKYYASVLVDTDSQPLPKQEISEQTTVGLDLGVVDFLTMSTGVKISNPRILLKYEKRLKHQQRMLSKKKKGSNNKLKYRFVLAKTYEKIVNIRHDFLNKLSHKLTHENQVRTIVIEDLNIKGMLRNHNLAKHISDCSWGEFIRQLEYKSDWYGVNIIRIGRFEPSSKICSCCGSINNNLTLNDRIWVCASCGECHDRDINAAVNIKTIGLYSISK